MRGASTALCELTVVEVSGSRQLLQPGSAYIGRGDADIVVRGGAVAWWPWRRPRPPDYPWHPSADRLVRSAMNHMAPSQLIGVLMTGMGNDGAEAMTVLQRRRAARTIAEAEETAVVWGMPGELVKADGADFVVPLPDIADATAKAGALMPLIRKPPAAAPIEPDNQTDQHADWPGPCATARTTSAGRRRGRLGLFPTAFQS